jgi:phosphoglycerol transferase MdoB-like AlkP superfamily enzyme
MSISDYLRRSAPAVWRERVSGRRLLRLLPLLALHAAALAVMILTEENLVPRLEYLLTWGLLNWFWIAVLRRPTLAAAVSLGLIVGLVLISRFKHDITWMTVDFLDLVIIDFSTLSFLFTIYPNLVRAVAVAALLLIPLLVVLWRLDPFRAGRRAAALACASCLIGLTGLSLAAPGNWWEVFSSNNYVSKFARSSVTAISELLTHGVFESDAVAAHGPPLGHDGACEPPAKLPHVILIHDESSFDIRVAPGIKVPEGYGAHFRSLDGKARKLLVESYGGASWYAEFNALTGLSSRSFGRFAWFLPRMAAGRIERGLPLALRRCGYRTFSFYPAASAFMSAKSFQMSTGIEKFYDYRDMGTKTVEPDSFYYEAAARIMRADEGKGPMFAFVYLAANHFPYERNRGEEFLPGWRDPGNTPEIDEYLRRQTRSVIDYAAFRARLERDFPGEPFLIVRYGDHEPAFPTNIIDPGLDQAEVAKRMKAFDPRYFTTYYAIDTINYTPRDLSTALDTLDAPYLPLAILDAIGMPLDASFAEQKKIFTRCGGIFYACGAGAEARRFNRLLIDAGFIKGL